MKKLLLLSLTILLFSCAGLPYEDSLKRSTERFLNTKRYNIPNSIKEQIRNADCEELEVLREKFKLKNNKDLRRVFWGWKPNPRDSVACLGAAVYFKRMELKCRKKLKGKLPK